MDINERIEQMEKELASLKEEAKKCSEFKFEYVKNKIYFIDRESINADYDGTEKPWLYHGRFRKTERVAKIGLARNIRANRLEAIAEQVGEVKEFVDGEGSYYIFNLGMEWDYNYTSAYYPEVVYMTKSTAEKVCELLNSGKVSLEV